jgi:hypothetical protein
MAAHSTPGHYQRFEAIGDVVLIHKGPRGKIAGVLIRINLGEPIEIVVLAERWPDELSQGCRLSVRGCLGQEREVLHRKNVHFVQADHVSMVRRWQPRYEPERGAR